MGNGRASRTQGGFGRVTRGFKNGGDRLLPEWRPAGSGVETDCSRVKKDAQCLWSALLSVVLLSFDLRAFEILIVRGFSCTGVAF